MKLSLSIALSHLLSHRRQTLVSLLGITLGVAFFMAVTSLMQGSDADFIKRLVDGSPHVTVYDEYRDPRPQPVLQTYPGATIELRSLKPRTEVRGIRQYKEKLGFISSIPHARVAPALVGQAIITFAGKDVGATINGVIPDLMRNVSTIDEHFVEGSLETLATNPDGIVLGSGLADKFRAVMGKNVTVASPVGVVRTMKIVGLFRTGNALVDENQAYVLLKRSQNLLNRPNIANRFVLQLDDPDQAPQVAKVIEAEVGYKAQSWQEASQDLISLLKVRRIIMNSVVGAILIVASFGIYNVISTVVLEKTRDIAIMKSVGFHARNILLIFLIEGAIVGAIGSILGISLGLSMMEALAQIQIKTPFNTEPAFIPLDWGWSPIALGVGFAMSSALAAAYLPARKGARVHPVDILRGAG
ncbi:MAG: ABC transporter permease [Rhodomicrobium sp.]